MGGKKWCEFCRVNIDYNKQAIQEHEQSRLHIQNKERQIKYDRRNARKQNKQEARKVRDEQRKAQQLNPIPSPRPISTGPNRISEDKLQQLKKYQEEVMENAKREIQSLIASKTQGIVSVTKSPQNQLFNPIPSIPQHLHKSQPEQSDQSDRDSDADDQSDESDGFRMWQIQICQQTKKPCFLNVITGVRLYEKPTGVVLTPEQTLLWEQLSLEAANQPAPDTQVNVGEWQEVADNQNIFVTHAVSDSQSSEVGNNQAEVPRPLSKQQQKLQQIQQMIATGTLNSANKVLDAMVSLAVQSEESVKDRNQKLKNLINNNCEMVSTVKDRMEREQADQTNSTKTTGFQMRKKIVKKVNLTNQDDIY